MKNLKIVGLLVSVLTLTGCANLDIKRMSTVPEGFKLGDSTETRSTYYAQDNNSLHVIEYKKPQFMDVQTQNVKYTCWVAKASSGYDRYLKRHVVELKSKVNRRYSSSFEHVSVQGGSHRQTYTGDVKYTTPTIEAFKTKCKQDAQNNPQILEVVQDVYMKNKSILDREVVRLKKAAEALRLAKKEWSANPVVANGTALILSEDNTLKIFTLYPMSCSYDGQIIPTKYVGRLRVKGIKFNVNYDCDHQSYVPIKQKQFKKVVLSSGDYVNISHSKRLFSMDIPLKGLAETIKHNNIKP